MSSEVADSSRMEAVKGHMQSLLRNVPHVCINRAQCVLVARRLQHIFFTLSRLPNPSPSSQMLSVFLSADMLVQKMRYEGWMEMLRDHFTCSAFFVRLFERLKKVWRLHSTALWAAEQKAAIAEDEVVNASVYIRLFWPDADTPSVFPPLPTRGIENVFSHSSASKAEQLIQFFRRCQLSEWRVAFEELTQSGCEMYGYTEVPRMAPLLFEVQRGYRYKEKDVVLQELKGFDGKPFSPLTVTAFVQDMVSRATWCHPNIIPFIGAFTEKMLGDDAGTSSMGARPSMTLGVILEDVTCLTVNAVEDNTRSFPTSSRYFSSSLHSSSYFVRPSGNCANTTVFCSLYKILFVQRRLFTLREAIEITLQVADALQYILMDEAEVPAEVAAAWTTVSPSNIFLCQVQSADAMTRALSHGRERPAQDWARESSTSEVGMRPRAVDRIMYSQISEGDEKENNEEEQQQRKRRTTEKEEESGGDSDKYVHLPSMGDYVAMYAPPVYIDGGLYSRWRPHPHAASPASYALTQLFIALLSNEPPYRHLEWQRDLAALVFEADEATALTNVGDVPVVKVSIPIGCTIPPGLQEEMRQLCQRGLSLRHSHQRQPGAGLSLEEFRDSLYEIHAHTPDLMSHVTVATPEEECYGMAWECSEPFAHEESHYAVEMVSLRRPLDDYGDLSKESSQ